MGKVFSWDEIAAKKVPHLESFPVVEKKLRQKLEAADGVVGGIIFGSVLGKSFTERSDLDCILVYNRPEHKKVVETFNSVYQVASGLYVPVGLDMLDSEMIHTPLYHVGLSFATHLRRAADGGGVIKKNPLPLFAFTETRAIDDLQRYLQYKLRKFEKYVSTLPVIPPSEFYEFLKTTLETPVHIARKVLWHQRVPMPDDSKRAIAELYPQIATPEEYRLFSKVLDADREYTAELRLQLQCPDEKRYAEVTENIVNRGWDTLDFIRLNALRYVNDAREITTAKGGAYVY